jgi:hypothetical protein
MCRLDCYDHSHGSRSAYTGSKCSLLDHLSSVRCHADHLPSTMSEPVSACISQAAQASLRRASGGRQKIMLMRNWLLCDGATKQNQFRLSCACPVPPAKHQLSNALPVLPAFACTAHTLQFQSRSLTAAHCCVLLQSSPLCHVLPAVHTVLPEGVHLPGGHAQPHPARECNLRGGHHHEVSCQPFFSKWSLKAIIEGTVAVYHQCYKPVLILP